MSVLELSQVTRTYGIGQAALTVLHDVDLTVEEGEYVAVVVQPGQDMMGEDATLPDTSVDMIARIRRSRPPPRRCRRRHGPQVRSRARHADQRARGGRGQPRPGHRGLRGATHGPLARLRDRGLPGRRARVDHRPQAGDRRARRGGAGVYGDQWFAVVGVLEPVVLAPELDETALIGQAIATKLSGDDLSPTTVYTRVDPDQVVATRALLGLGAVALLVGAVGIANVMVISVLERRREIGVRRALGATRAAIGRQFLTESVLLSLMGGLIGGVLGVALTTAFAVHQGWGVVLPWLPVLAGLGFSLLVDTVVGLYPALRAASVPPTEALRSI